MCVFLKSDLSYCRKKIWKRELTQYIFLDCHLPSFTDSFRSNKIPQRYIWQHMVHAIHIENIQYRICFLWIRILLHRLQSVTSLCKRQKNSNNEYSLNIRNNFVSYSINKYLQKSSLVCLLHTLVECND